VIGQFVLCQRHEVGRDGRNGIDALGHDLSAHADAFGRGNFADVADHGRASVHLFDRDGCDGELFGFGQGKELAVGAAAEDAVAGGKLPFDLLRKAVSLKRWSASTGDTMAVSTPSSFLDMSSFRYGVRVGVVSIH